MQHHFTTPAMLTESSNSSTDLIQPRNTDSLVPAQRKKRTSDNPVHQPSTLEKYISGVWESLYAGPKIDISEVVEQWQAIEADGQPKLLTDVEHEVATRRNTGVCKSVFSSNLLKVPLLGWTLLVRRWALRVPDLPHTDIVWARKFRTARVIRPKYR